MRGMQEYDYMYKLVCRRHAAKKGEVHIAANSFSNVMLVSSEEPSLSSLDSTYVFLRL